MAGVLVAVLNPQARIDGVRAAGGDPIPAGAVVSTDGNGAARMRLEGSTDCEIRPDSAVEVEPTPGLLMRLTRGTTVCDRGEATSTATLEAAGTKVDLGDATLALELPADEEPLQLRSYRGDAVVTPASGGKQVLRRHEELLVSEGAVERPPTAFDRASPNRSEQSAVERVQADPLDSSTVPSSLPSTTGSSEPATSTSSIPSFRDPATATSSRFSERADALAGRAS